MRNIFLVTTLFIVISISSFSQETKSGSVDVVGNFISWIQKWGFELSLINDREKLSKLYRVLGDINHDIDEISGEKYILALDIHRVTNFDENTISKLNLQIDTIKGNITQLVNHLNDLKALITQTKINYSVINDVIEAFQNRRDLILEDIKEELQNHKVDKGKIRSQAKHAKDIADTANTEIFQVRQDILRELER